jgi:hypothetical protein
MQQLIARASDVKYWIQRSVALRMLACCISFFSILILAPPAIAANPPKKLCAIIRESLTKNWEPSELCKKHQGNFCLAAESVDQAICRAHGGSFCATIENRGEALCRALKADNCVLVQNAATGYCLALGHPLEKCLELPSSAEEKWEQRFLKACP